MVVVRTRGDVGGETMDGGLYTPRLMLLKKHSLRKVSHNLLILIWSVKKVPLAGICTFIHTSNPCQSPSLNINTVSKTQRRASHHSLCPSIIHLHHLPSFSCLSQMSVPLAHLSSKSDVPLKLCLRSSPPVLRRVSAYVASRVFDPFVC